MSTGDTLNETNLLQNFIIEGLSSIARVDPQCDSAIEVAHTISLQQVAQVDAPGAAQTKHSQASSDSSAHSFKIDFLS
jgi:hypothetical protein